MCSQISRFTTYSQQRIFPIITAIYHTLYLKIQTIKRIKMESYDSFIKSSQDQSKQMIGAKRPIAASSVDVFEHMSSKSDLYDHLKNHLQVSLFIVDSNFCSFIWSHTRISTRITRRKS